MTEILLELILAYGETMKTSMNKTIILIALGLIIGIAAYAISQKFLKKSAEGQTYPFSLPKLPYGYNALEPYIDTQTMEIHHDKHHQKYVDELNAALKDHPELHKKTVEELLTQLDQIPEQIRTAVRNNGGGHYNHTFFWECMAPAQGNEPLPILKERFNKDFGGFDAFKEKFSKAAVKVFGSGYAWLVINKDGRLEVIQTSNQDSPISQGLIPVLTLDVWEHAYYLKYQNKRAEFVENWWNIVNWKRIENILAHTGNK